jgi:anti-sigma factor RsiW
VTCDESLRVLADAVDLLEDASTADEWRAHLHFCPTCRAEVETQLSVRWVLSRRPEDVLPDGFAERLALALDREQPRVLEEANWRKWSIWLLPAAAALLIVAINGERPSSVPSLGAVVASWEIQKSAELRLLTQQDLTEESLLIALLSGRAELRALGEPK